MPKCQEKMLDTLAFFVQNTLSVVEMDAIYEKTLLYDFYGELLTSHRREIYESVVFSDMSLSEAAEEYGVSRQGIHDIIKKCDEALKNYEEKLHLVEQFSKIKELSKEVLSDIDASKTIEAKEKTKISDKVQKILDVIS